ncbi:MAG: tetratricopeptide repeat protein [Paracoccus sp. (in: a-proteobacteria)]|uniref:tetratricopeptide repeat protein n=1 Tax=Paracoccus sp. TaxID=267 RepID=UPI0026DFB396|nr:tetratricopeptide repeat protein [Paracoccus sp. (in: a-proteobacteria)]MDO5612606.1 tetratricopeptide repeat protein [Paracoccus sp. (in: a-proteobacteria)]
MKGRGLLAVLGVSRGLRQTRAHVQDLLYSRSRPEQGAASIRQLLREIRLALDDRRDVLLSGPGWVGLDPNSVTVDLTPRPGPDGRPLEFAADLDIPDPEFEDWLRDTRMHFESRATGLADPLPVGPPRLIVQPAVSADPDAALLAEMLMIEAAVRASDITPLIVVQPGSGGDMQADLALRVRALRGAGRTMLSVSLVQTATGQVIWSQPFHIETGSSRIQMHLCAADITFAILKAAEAADALNQTRRFPLGDIFSYSRSRLMLADQVLASTYDQFRPAVALSLRAYIRNTLLIERLTSDPARTLDEADEFSRRALELAPHNATVLAVAAVIASYRNHKETEYWLVQQAVRADPLNPLAMFAHSLVLSDLNRHQEAASLASDGMNSALSALNPATWLLRRSAASFRHGDLDGARRFFTATHEMAPDNRPALRFLAALLYHQGDEDGARQALLKLKEIEPDFTLDLMAGDDYPVDSLRNAGMLAITRSGLI